MDEASLAMCLLREMARREEQIHGVRAVLKEFCVAPPLRRAVEFQGATQALRLVAEPLIIFPEHMHGADQPVLMSGVDFDEFSVIRSQAQYFRSEQRNIVIMNYVEIFAHQQFPDARGFRPRSASLLGDQ